MKRMIRYLSVLSMAVIVLLSQFQSGGAPNAGRMRIVDHGKLPLSFEALSFRSTAGLSVL